jgi:hypothetical protein
MALGGVVLTKKHAGIVGCICDIFQVNRSINPKWQFLDCASIAFGGRHEDTRELRRKMSVPFRETVWTDDKERHVDMPLHTIQHAKRMNICCRITTPEDSNFNQ